MLGKLTTLTVDTHNISRLEASAIGDGAISGKLERLHITNGNISDIPIEFLQVSAGSENIAGNAGLRTIPFSDRTVTELTVSPFIALDCDVKRLKKLTSAASAKFRGIFYALHKC